MVHLSVSVTINTRSCSPCCGVEGGGRVCVCGGGGGGGVCVCVWGGGGCMERKLHRVAYKAPQKRNPLELKDVNKAISLENAKGM